MSGKSADPLRVLVVDDDAIVLMTLVDQLEDLGHHVREASSAAAALELFRAHDDFALLVTDQAMPGMTGTDLIAAIDEIRPWLPAIIVSGYGEGLALQVRPVVRLGKPFTQEQLADAIAEAFYVAERLSRRGRTA